MNRHKKIIFLLTLVFALSNTGLPFALHLCQMMGTVSVETCDNCQMHNVKTCCDLKFEGQTVISKANLPCCETKIAAVPISDNYLSERTEFLINLTEISLVNNLDLFSSDNTFQNITLYCLDHSPPGLISTEKYISNLALLI